MGKLYLKKIIYSVGQNINMHREDELCYGRVAVRAAVDEEKMTIEPLGGIVVISNRNGEKMGLEPEAIPLLITALRKVERCLTDQTSVGYNTFLSLEDASSEDF